MAAALPRMRGDAASKGYTYFQGPEEDEERVICSEQACDDAGVLQPGQRLLLIARSASMYRWVVSARSSHP